MSQRVSNWAELPFREIWVVDTEFYPGPGLSNGGREGDQITPLCLVAIELRTGRVVRQWQGDFGPHPPYRLDADVLVISFMATAEMGFHIALRWDCPACLLDAYIEFRHLTNDARIKAGDRPKGFYSLAGALRYFGEDEIDTGHKTDMRNRIIEGPPFTTQERQDILDYCELDTQSLAKLAMKIVPTIPSIPHALYRGKYTWAVAKQESRGVPLDLPMLERTRLHWDDIRCDLVRDLDREYGCYEIVGGVPHFRDERFLACMRRLGIPWPLYADGKPNKQAGTFREMAMAFPIIENLRELRSALSQLRLNDLAVGRDGRNRTLLSPFGTKTGRNTPSNSKFVFGPAKFIRFFITPAPETVLIHRDFCQQEVRIAAILSGDKALLDACESGDVYLGIAASLGFEADSRPGLRDLFKTVVLGIQYGLGAASLAARTGISLFEAGEILARLAARFRDFNAWANDVVDYAGMHLHLSTPYNWTVRCPPGSSPRTIRNWPIQSAGAAVLHAASILAERRGIRIVAPIHDALLIEAPLADAEDASIELDRVMRDASSLVLGGYQLPTDDGDPIRPGDRYFDKRGEKMWDTVNRLVNTQIAGNETKQNYSGLNGIEQDNYLP